MGKVKANLNGGDSGSGSESKGKYRRWPEKHTNEYAEKREKNNAAVKKSREKARLEAAERAGKAEQLRTENDQLEQRVSSLEHHLGELKSLMVRGAQCAASAPSAAAADQSMELLMDEVKVLCARAAAGAAAAPAADSSSSSSS